MKNIIHIYGASGSGTSTLGRKICSELGYTFLDSDDYFWLPTNPPYTQKRDREERIRLLRRDIENSRDVVISGSFVDWGDEFIPMITLAVRLVTETEVRMQRLHLREKKAFGERIEVGGDMYETHQEFLTWAASYDTGDVNMRSKASHDEWEKMLQCKILVLNGAEDLEDEFEQVNRARKDLAERKEKI